MLQYIIISVDITYSFAVVPGCGSSQGTGMEPTAHGHAIDYIAML